MKGKNMIRKSTNKFPMSKADKGKDQAIPTADREQHLRGAHDETRVGAGTWFSATGPGYRRTR